MLKHIGIQPLSHLTGDGSHVDLGNVEHMTQTLHAVSFPAAHLFRQDLQFQILALSQVLALRLEKEKKKIAN